MEYQTKLSKVVILVKDIRIAIITKDARLDRLDGLVVGVFK